MELPLSIRRVILDCGTGASVIIDCTVGDAIKELQKAIDLYNEKVRQENEYN